MVTTDEFVAALGGIDHPSESVIRFLTAHARAPGRAANHSTLACAAGYKSYRAINLQYGLLARRVGRRLGIDDAPFTLLIEGAEPRTVTHREWVIMMRPEFAEALHHRNVRWIEPPVR